MRLHRSSPQPPPALIAGVALWIVTLAGCLDNSPQPRALGDGSAAADAADGGGDAGAPDTLPAGDSEPHIDAALAPLAPLRELVEGRFATSLECQRCHENNAKATAMRDAKSRPVSPFDLWRATAMANAGRDPIWRAVVAAEVEHAPSLKVEIESTCTRCHAPMAWTEAALNGESPLAMATLAADTARSQLALDGVSCVGCHLIKTDKLGTDASFTGGYVVNENKQVYGPHGSLFGSPMIADSGGFEPLTGKHVTRSALCATCHTLIAGTIDATTKQPTGAQFPEQAPYLEWRNSAFSTEGTPGALARSCQGCHMPSTDVDGAPIKTKVATRFDGTDHPGVVVREPYARHIFVGGNTLLPMLLKRFSDELKPNASAAAFDAVIARVRHQLSKRTATVAIGSASVAGGTLSAEVTIANLAGHKLPTGYPARRAVLQLAVLDQSGAEILVSGRFDAHGRLVGRNGQPRPSERAGGPTEPHHATIADANDVQVYEGVAADTAGKATYHLLTAASYLKDNRLLPQGWSDSHADIKRIAHVGTQGDADFGAGGDTVRYQLRLPPGTQGPLRVRARLYYQPLSARFADELFQSKTREALSLRRMLLQTGLPVELVAEATRDVTP